MSEITATSFVRKEAQILGADTLLEGVGLSVTGADTRIGVATGLTRVLQAAARILLQAGGIRGRHWTVLATVDSVKYGVAGAICAVIGCESRLAVASTLQ